MKDLTEKQKKFRKMALENLKKDFTKGTIKSEKKEEVPTKSSGFGKSSSFGSRKYGA